MSTSFATRTSSAYVPEGWPWRAPYRRSFLLSLAGVVLAIVNVVVLRAVWALGTGVGAWQAHLEQLHPLPVLALHGLLCAIACYFAIGFLVWAARLRGLGWRELLAVGAVAATVCAGLLLALLAGAFA